MNDDATKPLNENLQLINPHSDPVSWNLSKGLLAVAKKQQEMDDRLKRVEQLLMHLTQGR